MEKFFNFKLIHDYLEKDTWSALSEDWDFAWNDALLSKYQDRLDWDKISSNAAILWTNSMLEKFKNRINWQELSHSKQVSLFTMENLQKYAKLWDWTVISQNSFIEWSFEMLEELRDYIDWEAFIQEYREAYLSNNLIFNFYSIGFIELFKDYLPLDKIKDSALWETIVDSNKIKLMKKIVDL